MSFLLPRLLLKKLANNYSTHLMFTLLDEMVNVIFPEKEQ